MFSFTGISYLISSIAIGMLAFRFLQYWREEKTVIAKLFFFFNLSFVIFSLDTAFVGLFFANNEAFLKAAVIIASIITAFSSAIVAYLIIYLKFPRISPWIGFWVLFIFGLVGVGLTVIEPFHPFLEQSGGINWGSQPLADAFKSTLMLLVMIPLFYIFIQQFRESKDNFVKSKAFAFILAFSFGIVNGAADFFLENLLKLDAIVGDIVMIIISAIIIVLVLFIRKSPKTSNDIQQAEN
jgi:hypothetical protein